MLSYELSRLSPALRRTIERSRELRRVARLLKLENLRLRAQMLVLTRPTRHASNSVN